MKTTSEIKAIKDLTTEELAEVIDSLGDEYEDFSTFAIERLAEKFVSKQGKVLEAGTIWYVTGYDLNEDAEVDITQYCVISNNRYVSVTNEQIFTTSDRFLAFTGTKQEAQFVANKANGEVFDFEKVVVKSNTKIGKDGGEVELDSELIIK